ncbi:hypothetical protein CDAR_4571 [Caerostris darwini]|uniref:Uncharacterized protein n=1 Tax=Caerostris darwini TaxID=1538125 RepID=A0AAV4SND2_9ARAC|nr:hypothetical protein CDAR_4571 [Caerostris darwini]
MRVERGDSMRVVTRRHEERRNEDSRTVKIRKLDESPLSSSKSAAILLCLSFAKDYSVKAPEILLRSKEADSLENKRFLSTPKSSAVWKKSLSRQKNTPPLIFCF